MLIEESKYKAFKDICNKYKIRYTTVINKFIEKELKGWKGEKI